jgi:hypothetical protein
MDAPDEFGRIEMTEIETTRECFLGIWHFTERRWTNADGTKGISVMSMLWPHTEAERFPRVVLFRWPGSGSPTY